MGKKNLDKLFQEKLKDFSDIPSENVWGSIETSLNEKKKSRKIIPFWWKLGGVAAVLALALYVVNPFDHNNTRVDQPVTTDIDHTDPPEVKKSKNAFEKPLNNNGQIVDVEQEPVKDPQNVSGNAISNTTEIKVRTKSANTTIVSQGNTTKNTPSKEVETIKLGNNNPLIANKSTNSTDRPVITENNQANITLAHNSVKEKEDEETNIKNNENTTALNTVKNEVIDKTTKTEAVQIEKKTVVETTEAIKKKSIFDEIASQEHEEVMVENHGSKWSAGPSIAPVYFNSIGHGSPIHSSFVPNSKSGDVNLSFGLSVAYKVNRKLSIRSGLHKVDYGYKTNDVKFSSSLGASANGQLANVDYALASENLIVASNVENTTHAVSEQNSFLEAKSDVSAVSASREGVMAQDFGYLEVPLELDYAILDNRFGINLIGGVSSLFLVDNSISLTSGELTTEMGKANNINSINFSTNIGFGINYKFTPKVQFNVEPIFKYQLSTFSGANGGFRPFSVGVYSGLSFKF